MKNQTTQQQQADTATEQKRKRGRPATGQKDYTSICLYIPLAVTQLYGCKHAASRAIRKHFLAFLNTRIAENNAAANG